MKGLICVPSRVTTAGAVNLAGLLEVLDGVVDTPNRSVSRVESACACEEGVNLDRYDRKMAADLD